MVLFLIRGAIFLGASALGLLAAAALLPRVSLSFSGFLITVLVFAIAQSVLAPFIAKMAARNAPAFLGGIGLVSTFVALVIAVLLPGGIGIADWRSWILATMVVWLVTAVATLVLPLIFVRNRLADRRNNNGTAPRAR